MERIRIVSDLHLGHKASVVDRVQALRPLAHEVDHLVFNGDTLELKYGDSPDAPRSAPAQKQRFEREVATWGPRISLITGNHDPQISNLHSLSLLDGKVFVTHGDALFPEIAPWSSSVKLLRACCAGIDAHATGSGPEELHRHLAAFKQASIEAHRLDTDFNPTLWGKLKIFLHQAWPPTRPFRILKCWAEIPDRAVSLVQRFSLQPEFIVVGHTHNPGVWRRGPHTVINLGSLFPWPGARCIDIADGQLAVRRILKRRRSIALGPVVRRFPLPTGKQRRIALAPSKAT